MVHVVDFVEGNDRCHVTTPPGLGIGGDSAYDRGYKKQSTGGRGHLSTYGTYTRTGVLAL